MTFPLSVPSFGLSPTLARVRTKSATGVPLRQIVTLSPPSTALINSGSLFFASATLTFMIFNDSYLRWPCKNISTPSLLHLSKPMVV
jgi:hypothetical protein